MGQQWPEHCCSDLADYQCPNRKIKYHIHRGRVLLKYALVTFLLCLLQTHHAKNAIWVTVSAYL